MGPGGARKKGRPGVEALRVERKVQVNVQEAQPGLHGGPVLEGKPTLL